MNEQIDDKQNIIQTLKNEASERMSNSDEIVKNLNKKNEDLSKTIDEMTAEIEGMKHSLQDAQNEMLRKDIDIEALRKEMHTVNGQLTDYKSAHNELEGKYSGYVNKYKEIENKYKKHSINVIISNTALVEKNIQLQRLIKRINHYKKKLIN